MEVKVRCLLIYCIYNLPPNVNKLRHKVYIQFYKILINIIVVNMKKQKEKFDVNFTQIVSY